MRRLPTRGGQAGRMLGCWLGLAAVLVSVGGCAWQPGAQSGEVSVSVSRASAVVAPVDAAALRAGSSLLAGRLLSRLAGSQATVVFSPFSISEALAMTYAGARGQTASQMARALDFGLTSGRLHVAFNALDQELGAVNGPGVSVSVANALYGQQGTPFRPVFLGLLGRDYGAGMRVVDFTRAPEAARLAINAWVSQRTHAKITNLLAPGVVDALTRLVLVNAIYLNAKWAMPFDKNATAPAPFHAPGATVNVPTMNQSGRFGYLRGRGYRAVELAYRGGRLALDVLLPDPGGLAGLMRRLADRGPLEALRGLKPTTVGVALPKLTLRTHFELTDVLKALGMPLAFAPGLADLSGIAGLPGGLYIKHVIHAAYVRVDEAGTEAAAATGVVVEATAAPSSPRIVFDVNRPFVFVLRDTRTGAILFLGAVSHP